MLLFCIVSKPLPKMVTSVPGIPLTGLKLVICGGGTV